MLAEEAPSHIDPRQQMPFVVIPAMSRSEKASP